MPRRFSRWVCLREDAGSHYFGSLKCIYVLVQTQRHTNSDRSSMEETEMLTVAGQPAKNSLSSTKLLFASVALASLVYLAGLIYYAQVRPLDGDEGYYTTAARLVWEGKTPYKDFSYPQGVLLPYIYSWIWAVHPHSLVSMRVLSAACGAMAVFLWGIWLISTRRLSATVALATFAVILVESLLGVVECCSKDFRRGQPPDVHRDDLSLCRSAVAANQMVLHRRRGPGSLCRCALPLRAARPFCAGVAVPDGMALLKAQLYRNAVISRRCGLRSAAHAIQLCQRSASIRL